MAVKPEVVTIAIGTTGRTAGNQIRFVCLESDLAGLSAIDGDTAYATDTGNPYTRTGGSWILNLQIPVVAVRLLEQSGPTSLLIGSIPDGQFLKRVGDEIRRCRRRR